MHEAGRLFTRRSCRETPPCALAKPFARFHGAGFRRSLSAASLGARTLERRILSPRSPTLTAPLNRRRLSHLWQRRRAPLLSLLKLAHRFDRALPSQPLQTSAMGCWIAENSRTREAHVPGTSLLDDLKASSSTQEQSTHVKRDRKGIVLVPQPYVASSSPRNSRSPAHYQFGRPSRSPQLAHMEARTRILEHRLRDEPCWSSTSSSAVRSAVRCAQFFVWRADWPAHFARLRPDRPRAWSLCQQGGRHECCSRPRHRCSHGAFFRVHVAKFGAYSSFPQIPVSTVAIKWGRRPVYIWGAAFLLAGSIWSAARPDLDNLLASRVIQGCVRAHAISYTAAHDGQTSQTRHGARREHGDGDDRRPVPRPPTCALPSRCLIIRHIAPHTDPLKPQGMRVAVWGLSLLGGINVGASSLPKPPSVLPELPSGQLQSSPAPSSPPSAGGTASGPSYPSSPCL